MWLYLYIWLKDCKIIRRFHRRNCKSRSVIKRFPDACERVITQYAREIEVSYLSHCVFAALKLLMTIMTCDNEAFEPRRQLERDESEKEDSRRASAPVVAMTRRKNGGSWEDSQPSTPLSLLSCRASRRRNIDVPPTVCPSVSCSFSLLAISLSLSLRIHPHAKHKKHF